MDWIGTAVTVAGLLGTGSLGGFIWKGYTARKESARSDKLTEASNKLTEANVGKIQAEMALKLKESEMLFIEKLQEEKNYANARYDEVIKTLFEERRFFNTKLDEMMGRIRKLENTLIQHNIPVPE
jgi:hypothetical protein